MPLFGPPNVSRLKDKGDVNGLIKALSHKDPLVRQEAATVLGETGDIKAVDPLLKILVEDTDKNVRSSAATALGQIGDTRAVEPLISSLWFVDDTAIFTALRGLGEPAFEALIRFALTPATERTLFQRGVAIRLLETFKDARAISPLIKVLEEGWEEAAKALGKLAINGIIDKATIKPLIDASYSESERMRNEAYTALGFMKDEQVAPRLIAATLSDIESDCRDSANTALTYLAIDVTTKKAVRCVARRDWPGAVSQGKVSIEPLKFITSRGKASIWSTHRDHKNSNILLTESEYNAAISSLASIGGAEVLDALFEIYISRAFDFGMEAYEVCEAIKKVAEAMANIRDRSALTPLLKMLSYRTDSSYKREELERIKSVSSELFVNFGEPALEKLAPLLNSDYWKTRWETVSALSKFESERSKKMLTIALNDEKEGIRRRAEEALKKYHALRGGYR